MIQLYNKITSVKKLLDKTRDILTTHDLRQKISQHLDVPQSDLEAYIPFSEVLDEDDEVEPRFIVIITAKKLLDRMSSDRVLQVDATYRLVWQVSEN